MGEPPKGVKMSPLCYILAVITAAFAVSCVLLRRKNKSFEGMVCKFMASFGFISVAIIGYCANPHNTLYFCIVCFALMFGFCGDVLLGIKEVAPQFKSRLVVLGMLCFAVGHLFYLFAFVHTAGFNVIPLAIGIFAALFAFVMIRVIKMKANGKMRIIMSIYYGVLLYQASAAGFLWYKQPSSAALSAFVGAVLFVMSDTFLSFLYFTPVKRKNVWVTLELSTYYPAQILLAMSVALMTK